MYWFSRPPYGRWAAAFLIVATAAYMDLSGPAVESYPFVSDDAAEGESPQIEWRDVPAGVLPAPGDPGGRATASIVAGTPLVEALVDVGPLLPADWWAVSVDLAPGAVVGSDALLVLPGLIVEGIVIDVGVADSFGGAVQGLVAVAPEQAGEVAAAAASGSVTVLIRP